MELPLSRAPYLFLVLPFSLHLSLHPHTLSISFYFSPLHTLFVALLLSDTFSLSLLFLSLFLCLSHFLSLSLSLSLSLALSLSLPCLFVWVVNVCLRCVLLADPNAILPDPVMTDLPGLEADGGSIPASRDADADADGSPDTGNTGERAGAHTHTHTHVHTQLVYTDVLK